MMTVKSGGNELRAEGAAVDPGLAPEHVDEIPSR